MGTTTDELNQIKKSRKAIITIATAVVVGATPGVFSFWQSLKQEWKEKLKDEQEVRDKQEQDLQVYVKANKSEIDLLKITIKDLRHELSMTRTQLVSVVVLLSQQSRRPAVVSDAVKKLTKPMPAPKYFPSQKPVLKRPNLKPAPLIRKM